MLHIESTNINPLIKDTNVYIQDEILDKDLYLKLLETFPHQVMKRKDVHNKVALNKYNTDAVNKFLSSNINWKNFVDYFFSEDFISLLNLHFSEKKDNFEYTSDNINIGYEFSILGDGARVVPHKDKYGKLFSFVFYFVPEDWPINNNYGGTQFYEPKNKFLNLKFFNDSANYESMNVIAEIAPKDNRLMIFEPNHTSWHGVAPIITEDTFGRPAFIVTIHRGLTPVEHFYNSISRITSIIQKFIT